MSASWWCHTPSTNIERHTVNKDKAIGMFMGLFIGDALGAPFEFSKEDNTREPEMVGGGWLDVAAGEWTDDGAMAMCIADAYIRKRTFNASLIVDNFKRWRRHEGSVFGTRSYCFDVGNTCSRAIINATNERPYAGDADVLSSGNGSIMRLAPVLLANHSNKVRAVSEAVASALLTHGNSDTITYVGAFANDVLASSEDFAAVVNTAKLCDITDESMCNTVQYAYSLAHTSVKRSRTFEEALARVIRKGGDTDTTAAVAGMWAGARFGLSAIPQRWLSVLHQRDHLMDTAEKLYTLGCERKISYE